MTTKTWMDITTGEMLQIWATDATTVEQEFCSRVPDEDRENWVVIPNENF